MLRNEILASMVGISPRTLEKARKVVQAADRDPRYARLVGKMDNTPSVDGAYRDLTRLQREDSLLREVPAAPPTEVEVVETNPLSWLRSHSGRFNCVIAEAPCYSQYGSGNFESRQEFLRYSKDWLEEIIGVLAENGVAFVLCEPPCEFDLMHILDDLGYSVHSVLVWHHPNRARKSSHSSCVASCHFILHFGDSRLKGLKPLKDMWQVTCPARRCKIPSTIG